mgnify:CR=1 FL=1
MRKLWAVLKREYRETPAMFVPGAGAAVDAADGAGATALSLAAAGGYDTLTEAERHRIEERQADAFQQARGHEGIAAAEQAQVVGLFQPVRHLFDAVFGALGLGRQAQRFAGIGDGAQHDPFGARAAEPRLQGRPAGRAGRTPIASRSPGARTGPR